MTGMKMYLSITEFWIPEFQKIPGAMTMVVYFVVLDVPSSTKMTFADPTELGFLGFFGY